MVQVIPALRFIYVTVPEAPESLARFSPPGPGSGTPTPGSLGLGRSYIFRLGRGCAGAVLCLEITGYKMNNQINGIAPSKWKGFQDIAIGVQMYMENQLSQAVLTFMGL